MSRTILWSVEVHSCSFSEHGEIEVDDDATDEEITEQIKEEIVSNIVSWGWSPKE